MVIYKSLSIRTIDEKKKGKWHNLLRTGLQPTEHCKSMVVSGSHWNLLICYDIVLYTVWNTDSFPLYGFWSLNLFLCLCLFAQIWPLSAGDEYNKERERERERQSRGSTAEVSESFTYIFFIMKYFKNKLNTWKETSPANLDGLGVQGRPSKNSSDLILVLLLMTLCALSPRERLKMKVSFSSPGIRAPPSASTDAIRGLIP